MTRADSGETGEGAGAAAELAVKVGGAQCAVAAVRVDAADEHVAVRGSVEAEVAVETLKVGSVQGAVASVKMISTDAPVKMTIGVGEAYGVIKVIRRGSNRERSVSRMVRAVMVRAVHAVHAATQCRAADGCKLSGK